MLKGGVQWRTQKFTKLMLFTAPKMDDAFQWALTQEGKPYDWSAITGLALNRDWRREGSYFCSELVVLAFEKIGTPLLNPGMAVFKVTPRDLLLSPYIGFNTAPDLPPCKEAPINVQVS